MQYVLRRERSINTSLSQLMNDPNVQWDRRVALRARQGISEEDIAHWVWILEAPDADTKVDRFFSSDRPKPIFVLIALLRKDEDMIKQSSLVRLYDYVAWMCQRARSATARQESPEHAHRATMSWRELTPRLFLVILNRLTHHSMMRFPSSIVTVARLVADYVRGIPENHVPRKSSKRTGFANRCMVVNFAIQKFGRTTRKQLINLPHNWRAQRTLLTLSAEMQRPIILTRFSYTAIRTVLIGLKKEQSEKDAAKRHSKTWPPYIRQLDGLDEAKQNEEYLSRSVQAGSLKRQEGYADDIFDRALDILGGAILDESITVQTRSRPPQRWSGPRTNLQIFTAWAARVRATRNTYEAWQMFNESPSPGLKPNYQVYAEMFSKLYAKEVDPLSQILPGETKQVFPPYLGNWTAFEREILRPCSPEELYERMLKDGNRPVRDCLRVLLRNAPSVASANMYLRDSPLNRKGVEQMIEFIHPKMEQLASIPLPVFDAYVRVLCLYQGHKRWAPTATRDSRPISSFSIYDYLPRAIKLVRTRLGSTRKAAQEPWHTIMRALSDENVIIRPYVTKVEDDMDSLRQLLSLFQTYETTQTLHPFAFHCLARCVRKVARHALAGKISENDHRVVSMAVGKMKTIFWELVAPVKDVSGRLHGGLPMQFHEISSANVSIYIETLGLVEEIDEAARVMEWVLASYGQDGLLEKARDPGHKQWQFMHQAFICFRAFCINDVSQLSEAVLRRIEKRFEELQAEGSTWEWPSDEEVGSYVQQTWASWGYGVDDGEQQEEYADDDE